MITIIAEDDKVFFSPFVDYLFWSGTDVINGEMIAEQVRQSCKASTGRGQN